MIRQRANDLARRAALVLALAGLGCGGDFGTGDDDGDGDACDLSFSVVPDPASPGDIVVVTAFADTDLLGFPEYVWSVRFGGQPIEIDLTGVDQDRIEFTATQAGVYDISLEGEFGGVPCTGAGRRINVIEDGAQSEQFLLRIVPPSDDPSSPPAQDEEIRLYGGASDYELGVLTLEQGIAVSGTALDPDGQPVAAYLRAWPSQAEAAAPTLLTEVFSGADGIYQMQLLDVEHELLMVPESPELAPYYIHGVAAETLSSETRIELGNPATVAVEDGSGNPVAGARVSLVVDGVPSSVAVTDGAGASTVRVNAEGPMAISVVPPEDSGLPQLELAASEAGQLAAAGGGIAIHYAASLSSRSVSPEVHLAGAATPAPGSRVTWIARPLAAAGAISIDGGAAQMAAGLVRRTAVAGAGGQLPPMHLPEALYDVIIEPAVDAPDQAVAIAAVDLAGAAPAVLSLAAPAELSGHVSILDGPGEMPLAGVRVQATPKDILVGATRAGASARTDAEGRFVLLVAGDGTYEITIDGTPSGQARALSVVTAPSPGGAAELAPTLLPPVLHVTGELVVEGGLGAVAGAHLQLYCLDCGPDGTSFPVTETLTDATGAFDLIAPDPGVSPPQ